jgi:hypothetical protein
MIEYGIEVLPEDFSIENFASITEDMEGTTYSERSKEVNELISDNNMKKLAKKALIFNIKNIIEHANIALGGIK